jgi:hypothetical protein
MRSECQYSRAIHFEVIQTAMTMVHRNVDLDVSP